MGGAEAAGVTVSTPTHPKSQELLAGGVGGGWAAVCVRVRACLETDRAGHGLGAKPGDSEGRSRQVLVPDPGVCTPRGSPDSGFPGAAVHTRPRPGAGPGQQQTSPTRRRGASTLARAARCSRTWQSARGSCPRVPPRKVRPRGSRAGGSPSPAGTPAAPGGSPPPAPPPPRGARVTHPSRGARTRGRCPGAPARGRAGGPWPRRTGAGGVGAPSSAPSPAPGGPGAHGSGRSLAWAHAAPPGPRSAALQPGRSGAQRSAQRTAHGPAAAPNPQPGAGRRAPQIPDWIGSGAARACGAGRRRAWGRPSRGSLPAWPGAPRREPGVPCRRGAPGPAPRALRGAGRSPGPGAIGLRVERPGPHARPAGAQVARERGGEPAGRGATDPPQSLPPRTRSRPRAALRGRAPPARGVRDCGRARPGPPSRPTA